MSKTESPEAALALAVEPALEGVRVIACANPFSIERTTFRVGGGLTVAEIIVRAGIRDGLDARVFIEWRGTVYGPLPKAMWGRLRPKAGRTVLIRALPGQTGGGGDTNKTTRLVLQIVVLIVVAVLSYFTGGVAGGLIMAAGALVNYAINVLLPPPPPRLSRLGGLGNVNGAVGTSPTYSITGSQNKANLYGAIPKVFGRTRIFPPAGVQP